MNMHDSIPTIDEAMRRAIHERPQDSGDGTLPFSMYRSLQKCPGLPQLRQEVQGLVQELSAELKRDSGGYDERVNRWLNLERQIADKFVDFARESFVPSPALMQLEKVMHYFYYKFKEAPKYGVCLEAVSRDSSISPDVIINRVNHDYREMMSFFLDRVSCSLARFQLPVGELSLTSRDGGTKITIGPVSPLLASLQKTARDYYDHGYSHRRALLASAFLSALAMEEERVCRHYKLVVAELQNALDVKLPENWVNGCWNEAAGDVYTARGTLTAVRSAFEGLRWLE